MSLHTKKELEQDFQILSEVPTSETHTIEFESLTTFNFISYTSTDEEEREVNINQLLAANNASNIVSSPQSSRQKVKVLDYNIGRSRNYAEIKFVGEPKFPNGLVIDTTGRIFIEQKFLKPISKDFSREIDLRYSEILQDFKTTLKENQIPNLGAKEWEENFIFAPNDSLEWLNKNSFFIDNPEDKQGEIFYSKKLASYCAVVLTNEENYSNITADTKANVKNYGFNIITKYLNCVSDEVRAKSYYDFVTIIDINTEQQHTNQKIKFLVAIKHRHVAEFINQYSEGLRNFLASTLSAFNGQPDVKKALEELIGSPNSNLNSRRTIDLNSLLNTILDNTLTTDQKRLFDQIQDPKLREVANIFLNYKRDGSDKTLQQLFEDWKLNNPAIAPFTINAIQNLLTNLTRSVGNNFDVLIDETDPYIYFNFKDYDNTKAYVENLLKFLTETQSGEYKKYLETHEIIPSLNLSAVGSSCLSLIESAYQYSLNKIVIKEAISEREAVERINGFAIFLNADADPDSFFKNLLADVPDYFKALSVQIIYDDNKVIFMGSSKELDFTNITNLNDRTALFMLYSINYIMDNFYPAITISSSAIESETIRSNKILDPSSLEAFLSRSIFPYRRIIYKPKDDGSSSTLEDGEKCLANQWEAVKDDLANQTAAFRRSLFRSQQSFAKSKEATKAGWARMLADLDQNVGDIDETIYTLLSNVNINVLIATLIECLRKKGVPIELIIQLIQIIRSVYNTGFKSLCLVPPIKLPKLPTVNLDFEVPVVDLAGGLYETIAKIIKDLINNLILEGFKALIGEILKCEDAFADVGFLDSFLNSNINSRPGSQKNIDGSSATPKQAFEGGSSITETEITQTVFTGYLDTSPFINLLIPEFNMPADNNKKLIEEMQVLIERLSINLSSPDFLNLLTGRPSIETEIFIKDTVKADPKFVTLFASKLLSSRDGIIKIFTRLASFLDQEILSTAVQTTVQIITDANALCSDNAVESEDEALFLAKKYGEQKVASIKRKISQKQIETLKIMERFLTSNGFQDLIPPIKCRLNPDGTVTPGLLPSEPHPSEVFIVEKGLKTNFDILKNNFNQETKTAKLAYLSTISIPKIHPIKKLKKMYPDALDEDGDRLSNTELIEQRGLYYENVVSLNQDLKNLFLENSNISKTLDSNTGVETVTINLNFPKPDITSAQQALNNPQLKKQLDDLDDPEKTKIEEIKKRLDSVQKKINDVTSNFKNSLSFKDGEQNVNDSTKTFYTLEIEHSKLAPNGKITIRNEQEYDLELQKIFASLRTVGQPTNFRYFQNKKLFTKLLYKNNVEVNANIAGRTPLPANFDPSAIFDVYSQIYDSFEQSNKSSILKSIIESPLFSVNPESGKPNVLYLPLEAKQSDFCLSTTKDIHLLRLEKEKKEILKFYKNNKCFDKSKPRDGSASDELNSLERGTLYSYINTYFKIYLYDFYLRGIFVFNQYGIKDTNTKLMVDFFYNIFINDKKFMKIKKITKNNKFIFQYYKYLTKKDTTSQEEAYRYLIQSNMNTVVKALDKKLKKAGYQTQVFNNTTQTYETKFVNLYQNPININPLDTLIKNLDILTVKDVSRDNESEKNNKNEIITKTIVQDKDDLIRQAFTNYYKKKEALIKLLTEKYKLKVLNPFIVETRNLDVVPKKQYADDTLIPLSLIQGIYKTLVSEGSFNTLIRIFNLTDNLVNAKANQFLIKLNGFAALPFSTRNAVENILEDNHEASFESSKYKYEAAFLKSVDLFLTNRPEFSNLQVPAYYLDNARGIMFGLANNLIARLGIFYPSRFSVQENIDQVDSTVGGLTLTNDIPVLTQQQIEKLKSLSFKDETNINLPNFFSNFSLSTTDFNGAVYRSILRTISDVNIGAKGYSSGLFNNRGIFKDAPNEITRFTTPLSIINDSSLESPLNEFRNAYVGLKNICSKPPFDLITGQNKTVLIRQKRPNTTTDEYRYYIGNVYKPTSLNQNTLSKLDPNNAYTFTLKKKTTDTSGDTIILTIFARTIVDPDTFLLDKLNEQNKLILSIYESIFQPKKEFVFYAIAAMCQTSLMKDVDKIFNSTKRLVSKNIKSIINNNYDYINDEVDEDSDSFELSVFIKAALALPPVIIKGIAEAADPNIAFTSKISLAVKILKEFIKSLPIPPVPDAPDPKKIADEIPDIPVPFLSIPLGFTFPFIFTPLTIAYLALCGFSIDDEENLKTSLNNSSGESTLPEVCEIELEDPNDKEE